MTPEQRHSDRVLLSIKKIARQELTAQEFWTLTEEVMQRIMRSV